MQLLRAATLTVANVPHAVERYSAWLDYRPVEFGVISPELATAWGCAATAGRPHAILEPASGAPVHLRLVEGERVPGFRALRTHGWAAIEICAQDVLAVEARLRDSPFQIIGPPREIEGLPAIFPMQVEGPDQEIVYLTQIRTDLPDYDLPRAVTPIDRLFILVLACSDMVASSRWFERTIGLRLGRTMDIEYTMLARAFDLPVQQLHRICTMVDGRDVFLELDQYPRQASARVGYSATLPPGIAIGTFLHPDLDRVPGPWITRPAPRTGAIYAGRRAASLRAPDGTLVELIEAADGRSAYSRR